MFFTWIAEGDIYFEAVTKKGADRIGIFASLLKDADDSAVKAQKEATAEIMGVKPADLREDLIDTYGAVGTYIREARGSAITLFI